MPVLAVGAPFIVMAGLLLLGASVGSARVQLRSVNPYPMLTIFALQSATMGGWAAPGRRLEVAAIRSVRKEDLPGQVSLLPPLPSAAKNALAALRSSTTMRTLSIR
jgi:hypothetical protein